MRYRSVHEDGFHEGYVRFSFTDMNGDSHVVWEIGATDRFEPIDTTWSYQPFPGDAALS